MLALILDDVAAILRAWHGTDDVGKLRMNDFAAALSIWMPATWHHRADVLRDDAQGAPSGHHRRGPGRAGVAAVDGQSDNRDVGGTASGLLRELKATRESLVNAGDIAQDSYWPSDATRIVGGANTCRRRSHHVRDRRHPRRPATVSPAG